ncbi:MAG TPA: hypothetical protein VF615_18070 [Longimicrobiaceae bacterium]|jgi:hypothetical protein
MTYIADLAEWDPLGPSNGRVLAVGWLEPGHDYTRGEASPEFFCALVALLVKPWQPFAAAGRHRCPFCRFTGGPTELRHEGAVVQLGSANLFVPGDGCVFVAPSMAAHYVDAHEYSPPAEFQRAVLSCPPMRSMEYLRRLRELGAHRLGAGSWGTPG